MYPVPRMINEVEDFVTFPAQQVKKETYRNITTEEKKEWKQSNTNTKEVFESQGNSWKVIEERLNIK